MSTRSIVDPWNFQTYTYDWNEAEDPSPDQEMSILQKERERRKIQPPPRVDADSLLSTLEPHPAIARPQATPPPIEEPPPTLEDRMRAQPTFGAAVKFGLGAAMDPVGAATGDPNWPKRVIGDLVGPPDEPTDTSEMDPGTAFLARAKDVGKRVLRTGAEKSLGLASSPVTAYFGIPGVATSIPGRLAAGAFGVQAAAGGGDALGRAQALVDAGKDWSDPEVVDLLTSAGIDLGAAPFMLGHARTGVADMGRLPFVEKGANYIEPIARELGYLDDPFANLRSPMQHEGLPPTDWMVRNGYRMKKGGWYNDEGKLVSHEQINADFQADKALRANAPKLEFKQPDIQAGFEDWRNLPENRKFFGGRLSPERMKDALSAYNQYATEFAARKASTAVSATSTPKTVEDVMGDVGELPTEEPTGDFVKDVLEKPVEAAPTPEETVQPANVSEPAPIPEEPVEHPGKANEVWGEAQGPEVANRILDRDPNIQANQDLLDMTNAQRVAEWEKVRKMRDDPALPAEAREAAGRRMYAIENIAKASHHASVIDIEATPVAPESRQLPAGEEPAPISAEPEGIPVRHAIWNPELFRQMEEASRGAAPESPPVPPEESLPEPPARTSGLLDDIENIPAEAGPIEQPHAAPEALAKDHPLVKAYREDPNHIALESYDKELSPTEAGFLLQEEPGLAKYPWMKRALGLEEPTSPAGSVQQGAGTIESGTVQPETPAAPGKIVPGPETIVQEASSKPSVQPEAEKATSPTIAASP